MKWKIIFILKKIKSIIKKIQFKLRYAYCNEPKMFDKKIKEAEKFILDFYTPPSQFQPVIHKVPIIKEEIDLSIIIPVYNVEKYLKDCLDSIIAQKTRYKYEVLIINDGSKDNSTLLLKQYKERDNLIIIEQNNMGISGARNTGLDNAIGKYIMFVDSDDILEETIVEKLISEAYKTNFDIVRCGHYSFTNSGITQKFLSSSINLNENKYDKIMYYSGYVWGAVYRRELWSEIRFPLNFWFEDMIMQFIIYRLCQSFAYIPETLYGYRIDNENSFMNTCKCSIKSIDQLYIVKYLINLDKYMNINDERSLYLLILQELGLVLKYRTANLSDDIVQKVFILACDIVNNHRPKYTFELPKKYQFIEKSFLKKDYLLWKLAQ